MKVLPQKQLKAQDWKDHAEKLRCSTIKSSGKDPGESEACLKQNTQDFGDTSSTHQDEQQ